MFWFFRQKKPQSSARHLWNKFPSIESQMPIKLPNGSEVDEIECTCSDCKHFPILQSEQHGQVELTPFGAKFRMINRCILCGKFSFMSGDILMTEDAWFLAFPPPNSPMKNPWTGEMIPVRSVAQ